MGMGKKLYSVNSTKYWREKSRKSETLRLEHLTELKKLRSKALKLERENKELHFEIARLKE